MVSAPDESNDTTLNDESDFVTAALSILLSLALGLSQAFTPPHPTPSIIRHSSISSFTFESWNQTVYGYFI